MRTQLDVCRWKGHDANTRLKCADGIKAVFTVQMHLGSPRLTSDCNQVPSILMHMCSHQCRGVAYMSLVAIKLSAR
jgi:hypothetical protein